MTDLKQITEAIYAILLLSKFKSKTVIDAPLTDWGEILTQVPKKEDFPSVISADGVAIRIMDNLIHIVIDEPMCENSNVTLKKMLAPMAQRLGYYLPVTGTYGCGAPFYLNAEDIESASVPKLTDISVEAYFCLFYKEIARELGNAIILSRRDTTSMHDTKFPLKITGDTVNLVLDLETDLYIVDGINELFQDTPLADTFITNITDMVNTITGKL